MPTVGFSHRPVARGHHGLVASAHPLATLAGIDVLRSGGTAVDAAIAVNAVLAVVQPHMCGPGGDLFALLHDPPSGTVTFLDGAGRSGSGATVEAVRARGLPALPLIGPLAVGISKEGSTGVRRAVTVSPFSLSIRIRTSVRIVERPSMVMVPSASPVGACTFQRST